ncbi:conserved hypothetical protein [Ricinus communis]|uniref:Uncharacterized protein n=1 Tax=Ricinus communis TaxID=3988 RepID=B9REF9_RICCO|nr:conserved hypothetical protein [Ricinus communis]
MAKGRCPLWTMPQAHNSTRWCENSNINAPVTSLITTDATLLRSSVILIGYLFLVYNVGKLVREEIHVKIKGSRTDDPKLEQNLAKSKDTISRAKLVMRVPARVNHEDIS